MTTQSPSQPVQTNQPVQPPLAPALGVGGNPLSPAPGNAGFGSKAAVSSPSGPSRITAPSQAGGAPDGGDTARFTRADHNGGLQLSAPLARMPVALAVSVPVREFRVRNLLAMMPGAVIETPWGQGEDLPLSSGEVQLAWSEFEVVETRLAVRVTRLA